MDNLKEKVVIAVSSRALFDLEEEHALFEEKGYKAFRDHQVRYQNTPLRPGVAFPFVRRLLALNELYGDLAPFRVIALSRNSPETAQRFFHSCRHYRLPISAGGLQRLSLSERQPRECPQCHRRRPACGPRDAVSRRGRG